MSRFRALLLPVLLTAIVGLAPRVVSAAEPVQRPEPIEGVPKPYWFLYLPNWPFGGEEEVAAREGIPIARISLERRGGGPFGGGGSTITLCRDGSARSEDAYSHPDAKVRTGTVRVNSFGSLCHLIEKLEFRKLREDITPRQGGFSHGWATVVRVHRLGERDPILNWEMNGSGPVELHAIQSAISHVAENIEWETVGKVQPMPAVLWSPDLLNALNSLTKLTELEMAGYWQTDDANYKRVAGSNLNALSGLKHLTRVKFTELELDDEDLATVRTWSELASLDLKLDVLSHGPTLGELAELAKLRALNIEWPPIGPEPMKKLGALPQLTRLGAYFPFDARETLELPFTSLEELDASSMSLDEFALSKLPKLRSLFVRAPREYQPALGELRTLKSLSRLKLTGTVPSESPLRRIGELQTLKELDVTHNDLGPGAMMEVAKLRGLERLNATRCYLTDRDVAAISALGMLTHLDLDSNEITDAGAETIAKLAELESLGLARTRITDAALPKLSALPKLKELNVAGTDLTDSGLGHLQAFPQLVSLSVSGPSITDAGLESLGKLVELRSLSLSGARVTDAGLIHLKRLAKLERLEIDATRIGDEGLKSVCELPTLRELIVSTTRVTDLGMKSVSQMRELRRLSVSIPNITEAGIQEIARCTQLKQLQLAGHSLTPGGLTALRELKSLTSLSIARPSDSIVDPTTCADAPKKE